jgi:hypothetical protein
MRPKVIASPRIILTIVGDKPTPQCIVADYEPAFAEKPVGGTLGRGGENSAQIRGIPGFLSVNEYYVIWGGRGNRGEAVRM